MAGLRSGPNVPAWAVFGALAAVLAVLAVIGYRIAVGPGPSDKVTMINPQTMGQSYVARYPRSGQGGTPSSPNNMTQSYTQRYGAPGGR